MRHRRPPMVVCRRLVLVPPSVLVLPSILPTRGDTAAAGVRGLTVG
ncbi:hypothetical protein [Streptomyces sp. SID3343]|nr:hypothetical protein [Streptomyces sp. SID3343]